ncbi:MAG: hydrogenase maturation nickel metallochaperone HypA [Spirochaetes bacterium]|nr:hydrogenase maturation nickel metallochaperone HypA [Spirochaetota bacterium]
MHEYSITESIIKILKKELKGKKIDKIVKINIIIGKYSGYSSESIDFYFEILKKGTIFSSAKLNFIIRDIELECPECSNKFTADSVFATCKNCGYDEKFNVISGKELLIESLETE